MSDVTNSSKAGKLDVNPPTPRDLSRREGSRRMDFSFFPEDVQEPWPASYPSEGTQYQAMPSPDTQAALSGHSNWDQFMQWNSDQLQAYGEEHEQIARQDTQIDEKKTTIHDRRGGPSLGPVSTDSVRSVVSAHHDRRFIFGQPSANTAPSFGFPSIADPLISPAVSHAQQMSFSNSTWASQSPIDLNEGAIVSLMVFDGQRPLGMVQPQSSSTSGISIQQNFELDGTHTSPSAVETSEAVVAPVSTNTKKRKLQGLEHETTDAFEKPFPIKKTAHNMIEKRYRTNLNDKIAALRDSVPSLRIMSRTASHGEDDEDNEGLGGLTPAHKLNKATVLSKATEYIFHLEKCNKKLQDEIVAVKGRLDSLEKISMVSMIGVSTPDSMSRFQENSFAPATSATSSGRQGSYQGPPQGMISVPENMMAMHRASITNQAHYAHGSGSVQYGLAASRPGMAAQQPVVNGRHSNLVHKLMVGSLAGLMVMEGLSEHETSGVERNGRGLFALPLNLLGQVAKFFMPRAVILGVPSHAVLLTLKLFLILVSFGYLIFPLLDFKPRSNKKAAKISLSPAPSLASPIEVRRKAWLTAIQTVWVPRHSFVQEVAALVLKMLKLSTRKLIGWDGYAFLTGITQDQEFARVNAWKIALDAQLTGGDAEISMSRLVLTLMASGTLPDNPARLMLKALHIRILLWEVAKAGYGTWYMFDELSSKLARRYWNAARAEQRMMVNSVEWRAGEAVEPLPDHLAALLELDSDDVLVESIVQRAYNLAWNRPSAENSVSDDAMDSVVEDFAISSPLDALAAWWSNLMLGNVLATSLGPHNLPALLADLDVVVRTAPPASDAQTRAFVARAVLSKKDRMDHVQTAYSALPLQPDVQCPSENGDPPSPRTLLNTIGQTPVSPCVRVALGLAKCLALIETSSDHPFAGLYHQQASIFIKYNYHPTENSFSMLSFAASYQILDTFCSDKALLLQTRSTLELIANSMRLWIGRDSDRTAGIPFKIRSGCVKRCVGASKMLVGVVNDEDEESDAGYHSLCDEEEHMQSKVM